MHFYSSSASSSASVPIPSDVDASNSTVPASISDPSDFESK